MYDSFHTGNSSSLFPTKSAAPTVRKLLHNLIAKFVISSFIAVLFSTMNQSATSSTQKTVLNTQPFNNQLALLSQNIKVRIKTNLE